MGQMSDMEVNNIAEKCGYLKCQTDITCLIIAYQKNLYLKLKNLRLDLDKIQGVARQEKMNEVQRLSGELDALKHVWKQVSSLSLTQDISN